MPSRKKVPAAPTPGPKIISGVAFEQKYNNLTCLLWLFLYSRLLSREPEWRPEGDAARALHPDDKGQPYTGAGRYEHLKMFTQIVWPKGFEFHDWSERDLQSFCDYDQVSISGGGGTGKSASAALYALLYYHCCPTETGVFIVSTTVEQAKKRIWKMIFALYPMLRRLFKCSVMQMSPTPRIMTILRDGSKDEGHGIFVVPVAKGEEQKGINSLKGFHPRRAMLIGDETDTISQGVVDVQDNLRSGTNEFQAIWLGNDPSLFNPLGQIMQPGQGQPVTLEHTEWTSISGVHCLRKDGFNSPNIRDKDKWTGLMRQRDIDEIVRRNGGENTPGVYIMIRGLHPPEGVDNTVLSQAMLFKFHCFESVVWQRAATISVLLDPAFGGDRCVMRKMARGLDTNGKMKVLFYPPIVIPIIANDPGNPADYQIAAAVMTYCKAEGVPPEEFITDGTGHSPAPILQREWSPRIQVCQFGGNASDMPVSDEDNRPAKDVFDRRVTELYFSFREFVQADMVRGLDAATAQEFCERKFTIKGKKYSIMTKSELKSDGKPSPDLSDNGVLGPELLRRKGIHATIKTTVKDAFQDRLQKASREYDMAEDYADEFA